MVSFWPFKGDDNSAASFEKTLSHLSTKIQNASASNDGLRQHQRRYKALWTLYTLFAYILTAAILILVTGWQKWNAIEYTAMAGGPVLIYGVRLALDTYYNYRIARSEEYLASLNKQREQAIEKLKAATKYNSTQQLLDKYGGAPTRGTSPGRQGGSAKGKKQEKDGSLQQRSPQQAGHRTGFAPPPTANIPGRGPPPGSALPNASPANLAASQNLSRSQLQAASDQPGEEFAPNAFTQPRPAIQQRQPSIQYANDGPKWYDRIMDVVLGEDETQARNRIALICQNCRLVNGQAPPGARSLADIGTWRCSACHVMNGVESEAAKVLRQVGGAADGHTGSPLAPKSSDGVASLPGAEVGNSTAAATEDDETFDSTLHDDSPAGSTRSKVRQRGKA